MKQKVFFLTALALVLAAALTGQTVDTTGLADNPVLVDPTVKNMVDVYNILYGALVIAWGYIAKLIGLKGKVGNFVFIVLAGGVVIAGGFVAFGFGKAFPLLFSFLSAIGVYDIIFKPLNKALKLKI